MSFIKKIGTFFQKLFAPTDYPKIGTSADDKKALKSDWIAIGNDMRIAFGILPKHKAPRKKKKNTK